MKLARENVRKVRRQGNRGRGHSECEHMINSSLSDKYMGAYATAMCTRDLH